MWAPSGINLTQGSHLNEELIVIRNIDIKAQTKKEHSESVFHPFFSTKKGGTGLGLGIVKKIVEAHGGEIHYITNPAKVIEVNYSPCFRGLEAATGLDIASRIVAYVTQTHGGAS